MLRHGAHVQQLPEARACPPRNQGHACGAGARGHAAPPGDASAEPDLDQRPPAAAQEDGQAGAANRAAAVRDVSGELVIAIVAASTLSQCAHSPGVSGQSTERGMSL